MTIAEPSLAVSGETGQEFTPWSEPRVIEADFASLLAELSPTLTLFLQDGVQQPGASHAAGANNDTPPEQKISAGQVGFSPKAATARQLGTGQPTLLGRETEKHELAPVGGLSLCLPLPALTPVPIEPKQQRAPELAENSLNSALHVENHGDVCFTNTFLWPAQIGISDDLRTDGTSFVARQVAPTAIPEKSRELAFALRLIPRLDSNQAQCTEVPAPCGARFPVQRKDDASASLDPSRPGLEQLLPSTTERVFQSARNVASPLVDQKNGSTEAITDSFGAERILSGRRLDLTLKTDGATALDDRPLSSSPAEAPSSLRGKTASFETGQSTPDGRQAGTTWEQQQPPLQHAIRLPATTESVFPRAEIVTPKSGSSASGSAATKLALQPQQTIHVSLRPQNVSVLRDLRSGNCSQAEEAQRQGYSLRTPLPPAHTQAMGVAEHLERQVSQTGLSSVANTRAVGQVATDPATPASTVREISVRLPAECGERVEIRVKEQAGDVRITVHAREGELVKALRQDLPDLMGKLEQRGVSAEIWRPTAGWGADEPTVRGMERCLWTASSGEGDWGGKQQDGGHEQRHESRRQQQETKTAFRLPGQSEEKR